MFKDNALSIELHRRGKVEQIEIQADRALVGSGAHCDLRLSPDEAAVEHVLLEARDDHVHAEVRSFDNGCTLNGAPFLAGKLSPDALVELGAGVAIRVTLAELEQTTSKKPSSEASTHPAVQALGVLAILGGLWWVMHKPKPTKSALEWTLAPPTLSVQSETSCRHADLVSARAAAEQSLVEADNKRERSPFYPSDGLAAVQAYATAAACFAQAGELAQAREAQHSQRELRASLEDELRMRHVRLERLMVEKKFGDVRHEVHLAQQLVTEPGGTYASWLHALEREAELRVSQPKKKRGR